MSELSTLKSKNDAVEGIVRKSVFPKPSLVIPPNHQMIRHSEYIIDGELIIQPTAELIIL